MKHEMFVYKLIREENGELTFESKATPALGEEGVPTDKVVKGFAVVMFNLLGKEPGGVQAIADMIKAYGDRLDEEEARAQ